MTPAKDCTAKTARSADPGVVAANPADFVGRCVKVRGFWRDFGFYPTHAEAGQPDALSVSFLDTRRLGLYLSDADLARAPTGPSSATAFGTVGVCADLGDPAKLTGYCGFKHGAYLAVVGIQIAK
ncbi:hypothetical protein [Phenylobacterium sp.]|uniref:hypothetical protein n=1 Tax=Phenylobacterium sp. TaxID=1871053 RepID=UPI0025FB7ED8|nr:hypothetical protein [Phenylobacterium sp.]